LKIVPASGDSLLFFDFSPFEQSVFGGYRLRFHMYSLTGKVSNPAAWKMTLKGADGVMIVADSTPEMLPATRESISSLRGFLAAYGVGLHDIPCVLQLNRFGGNGSPSETGVAAELDVPGMQICHSDAGSGEGVLKALSLLSRAIMARIEQNDALREKERPTLPDVESDPDEPSDVIHAEPEEELLTTEQLLIRAEGSALPVERQVNGGGGHEPLQVALAAGEGVMCIGGAVRIPLEISFAGESRRLVVSIAIEQV
jgi:hypothetical protein